MTTPLDAQQNEPSTPILESGLATRTWYLKLSATWHNMSQVLGLKRLQELIQVQTGIALIMHLLHMRFCSLRHATTLPAGHLQLIGGATVAVGSVVWLA